MNPKLKSLFLTTVFIIIIIPVKPLTIKHQNVISEERFPTLLTQKSKISASRDGIVTWTGIYHNTFDSFYRSPGFGTTSGSLKTGAVPVGTDVRLRLRTVANDTTSVTVRVWDGENAKELLYPMSLYVSTNGYDYFEAIVKGSTIPNDYYYVFIISDGSATVYYNDDGYTSSGGRLQLDEGVGQVYSYHNYATDYGIVFYDPSFKTPDWAKQGVAYQLFPDRFFNGEKQNDPLSSDITWFEWDSNGDGQYTAADSQRVFANPKQWSDLPTSGGEFYGGDLQGVIQKADYLKSLGVNFIWFNPITVSPDYHGYSVDNYWAVDPYLGLIASRNNGVVENNVSGGLQVFSDMVNTLNTSGIKAVFDTVINHVSAQSIFFQRFENSNVSDSPNGFNVPDQFPSILGAYESPTSPYRSWFNFISDNSNYDAWWGFKNIPTLKYNQNSSLAQELISGPNSIFTFWQNLGVKGFRLDVNPDYDDGDGSRIVNKLIRDAVKTNDPNTLIIGEVWERANTWLTGTMNDAVQNMPFRDAVIDWLNGLISENRLTEQLYFPIDSYSPASYSALWSILGNHDTPRILTSLGGNVQKLKMAVLMQFSYIGVPMIYYGDEAGLTGGNDPDNRRPFPWGSENQDILNYYKNLTNLRQNEVFFNTSLDVFSPSSGVITLGRNLHETNPSNYTLTVINKNPSEITVKLNLSSYESIKAGDKVINAFDQTEYTVDKDKTLTVTISGLSGIILFDKISNSVTSSGSQSISSTINSKSSGNSFGFEVPGLVGALVLVYIKKFKKNNKKN